MIKFSEALLTGMSALNLFDTTIKVSEDARALPFFGRHFQNRHPDCFDFLHRIVAKYLM